MFQVKALQEEKKALEEKLEAHYHSNQEERDKAAILASERRARTQVSSTYPGQSLSCAVMSSDVVFR